MGDYPEPRIQFSSEREAAFHEALPGGMNLLYGPAPHVPPVTSPGEMPRIVENHMTARELRNIEEIRRRSSAAAVTPTEPLSKSSTPVGSAPSSPPDARPRSIMFSRPSVSRGKSSNCLHLAGK